MAELFAGIDVGGDKRGFSVAVWDTGSVGWVIFDRFATVDNVVSVLGRLQAGPELIAIDCPPRATISRANTRTAEGELHASDYRVQLTRRHNNGREAPECMLNGQNL